MQQLRQGLPCNEEMETVEPALSEVLQGLNRTNTERPLLKSEFVTKHANEACCRGAHNTVRKLYSDSPYNMNRILIIQAVKIGAFQKVETMSLCTDILYLAHYPVFADRSDVKQRYHTLTGQYCLTHMVHISYTIGA